MARTIGADLGERALYRKVILRIIPFIFCCYVLNYVDRVNVSFAKLQFQSDLRLDDASYGLGVGLFYIGYVLFEVPSNLALARFGARRTIARIMGLWGVISMGMALVSSPAQFYVARIALGAAEAGFFPGIILYLTYWFPQRLRGRVMSFFVLGIAVSGIVGGPASGWISQNLAGVQGLHGWQWLFIVEGLLPVMMGVAAWFVLDDRPADARWLTEAEKRTLEQNIEVETAAGHGGAWRAFLGALRQRRLWVATIGYFACTWAGMVLNFWSPTIIRNAGVKDIVHVGLLSALPYVVGAAGMIVVCRSSDRLLERRWHFAGALLLAAVAVACIGPASGDVPLALGCLAVLAVGYLSATALFWTIPTTFLDKSESAGSLAFMSSMGQVGGLLAPATFGWVNVHAGGIGAGTGVVAVVLVGGAAAVLSLRLPGMAGGLAVRRA